MISVSQWQPADGLTLEPNALRAATETTRSLALTAGPGAGKTEMLAQRADFLLRTGTCRYPRRMLAISFKVDACHNLKERVTRRCGHRLASRFDSYTFHAFAKRLIDRFRPVLTGEQSLMVGFTIGENRIPGEQIMFKDLIPFAIKILNSCEIARNAVRQTYGDVFLDEFQDCTNEQYALLKLIFCSTDVRLTAVGDTKQKIMGWAGALDGIFQTFASDFNAAPLNLYRNFRSQPRLLRMQNDMIAVLDPDSRMPNDQLEGEDGVIEIWPFDHCADEATHLANTIEEWVNYDEIPLAEIAVLVSKQPHLYTARLMSELEVRSIPFRNEQAIQDVSVEPAARLIVDYLSCLYGDKEPAAWSRLMAVMMPHDDDDAQMPLHQFFRTERERAKTIEAVDDSFEKRWSMVVAMLEHLGLNRLSTLTPEYESHARLGAVIIDTKTHIENLLQVEVDLNSALSRFSDDQAIRILTIHKSKGLEFDNVVVCVLTARARKISVRI